MVISKWLVSKPAQPNAIVFGNANDPKSELAQALKSERSYYVLEELKRTTGHRLPGKNQEQELN